jgi:ATP-dependent DNA ligase
VTLPVTPPLAPMLAKAADAIPVDPAGQWLYEPKWDGFRCIAFRDGGELVLTSRKERPFNRYFPEVVAQLAEQLPSRIVVDGEIVVAGRADRGGLDFDALLQRIHPAESRVRRLAEETPALFIGFDVLAIDDRSLLDAALRERRPLVDAHVPLRTPATTDPTTAADWFTRFEGAGLDGIVAKPLDSIYQPDVRGWIKVKHERTAECVVAGFRTHKDGQGVGSLLLGLFDDDSKLHHVGVAASFTAKERRNLLGELEPLTHDALTNHPWREWAEASAHAQEHGARMPGAPSRWNTTKDLSWTAIRPERVVEVTFTQLENGRFRHNAHVLRWRPDREPSSCRYDQLNVAARLDVKELLGAP